MSEKAIAVRHPEWSLVWRVCVLLPIPTAGAFGIVTWGFPHGFWFFRLWVALAVGLPVSVVASYGWHWGARSDSRVVPIRRVLPTFLALGALSAYGLLDLLPSLAEGERVLALVRSIPDRDVLSIRFTTDHDGVIELTGKKAASQLFPFFRGARMFHRSHEKDVRRFRMVIVCADDTFEWDAAMTEYHRGDLCIRFRAGVPKEVLLPRLAAWLSRVGTREADTRLD